MNTFQKIVGLSFSILIMTTSVVATNPTKTAYATNHIESPQVKQIDLKETNGYKKDSPLSHTLSAEKYMLLISSVIGFQDKQIESIKIAYDFNNRPFIIIECYGSGYLIYDYETDLLIEYSASSLSPYLNYTKDLIYNGPRNYYCNYSQIDSNHYSFFDIMQDQTFSLSESTISSFQSYNCSFANIIETKRSALLSKSSLSTFDTITSSYSIENYQYISELYEFGNNTAGTCGYIAAGIVLYYHHRQNNRAFIPEQYLVYENGIEVGFQDSLHQYLIEIGRNHNIGNSTSAWDINTVMVDYCTSKVPSATHSWSLLSTPTTILNTLLNNKPIILFGSFQNVSDPSSGNVNHAIVVYGETIYSEPEASQRFFRVHYGWEGYSDVNILDSILVNPIGSTYTLTP